MLNALEHCENLRRAPIAATLGRPYNRLGGIGRAPVATITEMVAAVVVHSSAAAFSHFGVTLDAPQVERPQPPRAERVVARSPRKVQKAADCPEIPAVKAVSQRA